MIQFQRNTDKTSPGFCWPGAALSSVLPWENISCFIFINIYVIPSGKRLLQKTEHAAPWHNFNCLFTHERSWACTQPRIFAFLSPAFLSFRVLFHSPPWDLIMSWATELSSGSGIWISPLLFGELLFWAAEIGTKYNVLLGITLLSCPVIPFPFWFEAPLYKK